MLLLQLLICIFMFLCNFKHIKIIYSLLKSYLLLGTELRKDNWRIKQIVRVREARVLTSPRKETIQLSLQFTPSSCILNKLSGAFRLIDSNFFTYGAKLDQKSKSQSCSFPVPAWSLKFLVKEDFLSGWICWQLCDWELLAACLEPLV